MGTYHNAHLVYGYDLGDSESHLIQEVDKYGSLDMSWIKRDAEGYPDESLTDAFTRRLYEAIPGADPAKTDSYDQAKPVWNHYGVKVLEHGWLVEGDTPSYALIAHEVQCDGGAAEQLDLAFLIAQEKDLGLSEKLANALRVLEVTPVQEKPSWLLLASR
jgi:hypothetical protein